MTGHEPFEEAIPLYAVGALERAERQALEAHLLTGCPTCHAVLKEYQSAAALLPHGLPPAVVPADLKKRTMAAAFQSGPRSDETVAVSDSRTGLRRWLAGSVPPRRFQPALTVILSLCLIGTGLYAWMIQSRTTGEMDTRRQAETALHQAIARTAMLQQQVVQQEQRLAAMREEFGQRIGVLGDAENTLIQREVELEQVRGQLAQLEKDAAGLRRAVAQRDEMLTFLRSAHVKVVSLSGLETAKSAGAFLLYDQDTKKAFFYAFNMPSLPPGKTYQLWAIVDKPMSAGVFKPDDGHKSRLILKSLPDLSRISKFAVSLEPEGGRPQPTGDLYLAGQL